MRTGIATVCLSGTLREKMQACATAGFDGIEIFEQDLVTSPLSPEDVRKMAADLGLSLDLYQPFRDFDSVPADLLAANLRRADAKFRLMSRLGMDTILVCSNVATASIDDDGLRAEQLAALAALAQDHGVKVAYEALAWGKYVNDYEHAHRLVAAVDHPNLGTCLDSFHILSRDWDTAPIETFDPEKIFFVQVADAPKLSMDVLSWSRHYRVFPGEGQFELAKFLGHVVRAGYTGPVSLEVFNDVFRQSDVERTAVDAMRSLIWLEEQGAKWLDANPAAETGTAGAGTAATGRRRYPMELATLPQVAEPAGFNFAEVGAADTAGLETLLGQLGFAFNGRHRTKNVQLWTMGHARVIINEESPEESRTPGAATAPAISALGFDVDSPVIAAARAQQLKAPAVPRKSQANEEIFQGFAAPDSTEIFLCQGSPDGTAVWTREFGEGPDAPPAAGQGSGCRDRPRQPRAALAALRRSRAFLHQRPGPGTPAVRGSRQPHRPGPVPGDGHPRPLRPPRAEPGPADPARRCPPPRNTSPLRWMTSSRLPGRPRRVALISSGSRKTTTRTSTPGSAWNRPSWRPSGSSTSSMTATPTASSCTSIPPPWAACSLKWSSAAVHTTATGRPTPRCGTPSSTTTCTS